MALTNPHLSDADLVLAARAGDRDALAALFTRHRPLLVLLCRREIGDADLALEATQEACLLAMLNLDRLRRPSSFGPWLAGIGLNVCRRWLVGNAMAHVGESALTSDGPSPDEGPSPEEAAEKAEVSRQVRRAVDGLPRGQRDAVLMHYIAGLNQSEVAELLGIQPGAVKARLHKARGSLRRRLWRLWKEETEMEGEKEPQYVEMRVTDVRWAPSTGQGLDRFVVVLRETAGTRGLPIWIGPSEGRALASILAGTELPRPDQYHFADRVLSAAGGRLSEVRIARLADITYYAEAVVEGPSGRAVVDARPSDAMALALMHGASILAEGSMLDALQQGNSGSWDRFIQDEEQYPQGAAEIAAAAKKEWEQGLEEFRQER